MTVLSVQPESGAEVESRFQRFDIQSQMPENMTEANRKAFLESEEEFAQSLRGRSLTLRYDRAGRLEGLQGADENCPTCFGQMHPVAPPVGGIARA